MTHYTLILIVHVTAAFILFAGLATEALSIYHLRRASTFAEAQPWFSPWPRLQFFVGGSGIVILSTGIALVHESSTHPHWAKIAAISLVLTVPLGAASARRLRAIRALGEGEMLARLRDTFLKRSINVRIALFFGIFVLVSIKPALGGALFTILSSIALGLLASFRGFGATTASIEKTAQHANAQRTGT